MFDYDIGLINMKVIQVGDIVRDKSIVRLLVVAIDGEMAWCKDRYGQRSTHWVRQLTRIVGFLDE